MIMSLITAQDLKEKLKDFYVIDVREPEEYKDWHIPNSINIPLGKVLYENPILPSDKEIVTVCLHGIRSGTAANFLKSKGFKVNSLRGGMVAWNSVYNIKELNDSNIKVLQFQRVGKGCLSYILISNNEAIIIDPTTDTSVYIEESSKRKLKIIAVLDTHSHADHVSGSRAISHDLNIPYYAPSEIGEKFSYTKVTNNTSIKLGSSSIKSLETPGHTPGSITYLIGKFAFVFKLFTQGLHL